MGKGVLIFYIHLVIDSIGICFPTSKGVSLIVSEVFPLIALCVVGLALGIIDLGGGLLGVSFLLGCWAFFLGVPLPDSSSIGMLASIMGTILGS